MSKAQPLQFSATAADAQHFSKCDPRISMASTENQADSCGISPPPQLCEMTCLSTTLLQRKGKKNLISPG